MNSPTTEWVVVPDNTAVIASETGEVWFLDLDPGDQTSPFAKPMTGKGTRGSTGALLNGVVSLGFGRDQGDANLHTASLPRYVFDLVGSYHNSRRTPGHFLQAAKRFREIERPDLASYLETHAREETGHDRLVLKDLRALGLPAERIVANLFPDGIKPVWEFFDRLTSADYPIGSIGYSYCFEYTAAMKKEPEVDALAALCPPGIDASRFLRTHSGLGSEVSHVDDMVDFIAGLPAADRSEIAKVAYDTAVKLAAGLRRHSLMSETEILAKLQAAAGQEIRLGG
jgi:hypothetical protein